MVQYAVPGDGKGGITVDKNSIMWPPGQQEKDKPEAKQLAVPGSTLPNTGTYKQTTDKRKRWTNTLFITKEPQRMSYWDR